MLLIGYGAGGVGARRARRRSRNLSSGRSRTRRFTSIHVDRLLRRCPGGPRLGETEFSDCCGKWGFDQDGWFGGGFIGFNWQKDRFVFGIEGDANAADIERSEFFYGDKYSSTIDALYSIRGRAGFAHDNWLIFATGGWAWATLKTRCTSVAGASSPRTIPSTAGPRRRSRICFYAELDGARRVPPLRLRRVEAAIVGRWL